MEKFSNFLRFDVTILSWKGTEEVTKSISYCNNFSQACRNFFWHEKNRILFKIIDVLEHSWALIYFKLRRTITLCVIMQKHDVNSIPWLHKFDIYKHNTPLISYRVMMKILIVCNKTKKGTYYSSKIWFRICFLFKIMRCLLNKYQIIVSLI